MTTVRQAFEAGELGVEWVIEELWEVVHYIASTSSHCVTPRFNDSRQDYFATEEMAEKFKKKIEERHPERTVFVKSALVLNTGNGKKYYPLGSWVNIRKSLRLDNYGF